MNASALRAYAPRYAIPEIAPAMPYVPLVVVYKKSASPINVPTFAKKKMSRKPCPNWAIFCRNKMMLMEIIKISELIIR